MLLLQTGSAAAKEYALWSLSLAIDASASRALASSSTFFIASLFTISSWCTLSSASSRAFSATTIRDLAFRSSSAALRCAPSRAACGICEGQSGGTREELLGIHR